MAKTENKTSGEFVNPLAKGVSYNDFIKALGEKSVKEYLEGKEKAEGELFSEAEIDWIAKEIKAHELNEKNKEANLKKAQAEHTALVRNANTEIK
jgi:hypothetical protein